VDPVEVPHGEHRTHERLFDGRASRHEPQCYAPRVRILSRRFLASYLAILAACVGGLLLALAIVDMLVDFGAVVEGGGAALVALLARVPGRWLREALPLASFAAAFLAVAIPARRGEILAVRAAGIHPARVTLPILGAAMALGASTPFLPENRSPLAAHAGVADASQAGAAAWGRSGDRVYRMGRLDPRSGGVRDLSLFELDAAFRLRRWLHAEQARATGAGFELRSAQIRRFDPSAPGTATRAEIGPAWLPVASGPTAPDARTRAADAGPAAPPGAAAAAGLLALLAIPLGLGVRPAGSLAPRALAALAFAGAFRGAGQAAGFGAERGASAAPWLVLAAFAALAAALWARAPR